MEKSPEMSVSFSGVPSVEQSSTMIISLFSTGEFCTARIIDRIVSHSLNQGIIIDIFIKPLKLKPDWLYKIFLF